ncbi:hypothetical protein LEP1GSC100_5033 [Leptospira interrogans serovar Bataviae str. UI 08561]|nr:hypothetical protein LEP1GSC100_5033 [Leptospira interrogans serovar Bataviae str. UI 08561]
MLFISLYKRKNNSYIQKNFLKLIFTLVSSLNLYFTFLLWKKGK